MSYADHTQRPHTRVLFSIDCVACFTAVVAVPPHSALYACEQVGLTSTAVVAAASCSMFMFQLPDSS